MRVAVIEMRMTGKKLSKAELAAAKPEVGELTIDSGVAYLHQEVPQPPLQCGSILPPLYDCTIKLRGDSFVLLGTNYKDDMQVKATNPQAWWCRLESGAGRR